MAQPRLGRHGVVDMVFQRPGVGEVQALVHPQAQDGRVQLHRMAQHVAEVLGARHQAHSGDVRPAGAVQEQRQRHRHAHHQAGLHAQAQGGHQRGRHGHEVGLGVGPGALEDAEVHQRQHGHHDGGGQRGLGQVVERRRQHQRGQQNARGGVHAGGRRLRAGIEVDDRAREATGHRQAACECGRQVAGAQGHQLLVGHDALAPLGRQRLAHRHRFDEAHHAQQQRRHRQLLPQRQVPQRQGERRQALRDVAHHLHALGLPAEGPGQAGGDGDGRHRAGLGQHVGRAGCQAQAHQQRLEPLAHPEQEGRGAHAHQQRRHMGVRQLPAQGQQQVHQGVPVSPHAQQRLQLAGGDQQCRRGDEARDHRMAEEVGQEAQPQQAHGQQHRA